MYWTVGLSAYERSKAHERSKRAADKAYEELKNKLRNLRQEEVNYLDQKFLPAVRPYLEEVIRYPHWKRHGVLDHSELPLLAQRVLNLPTTVQQAPLDKRPIGQPIADFYDTGLWRATEPDDLDDSSEAQQIAIKAWRALQTPVEQLKEWEKKNYKKGKQWEQETEDRVDDLYENPPPPEKLHLDPAVRAQLHDPKIPWGYYGAIGLTSLAAAGLIYWFLFS